MVVYAIFPNGISSVVYIESSLIMFGCVARFKWFLSYVTADICGESLFFIVELFERVRSTRNKLIKSSAYKHMI